LLQLFCTDVCRPKAYHGGFSLGFNCAEAVNFACADWLPWGQDAISKYRSFKHLAAFSLQKLLCNIAETPAERLVEDGERSLRHVAQALEAEVKEESELRDSVFSCGAHPGQGLKCHNYTALTTLMPGTVGIWHSTADSCSAVSCVGHRHSYGFADGARSCRHKGRRRRGRPAVCYVQTELLFLLCRMVRVCTLRAHIQSKAMSGWLKQPPHNSFGCAVLVCAFGLCSVRVICPKMFAYVTIQACASVTRPVMYARIPFLRCSLVRSCVYRPNHALRLEKRLFHSRCDSLLSACVHFNTIAGALLPAYY
jgi:hypothetical protein